MRNIIYLLTLLFSLCPSFALAQGELGDSIDRDDADFVKAYLIVASPGDLLYSTLGHACLRLNCPSYDLDYCFSYESEDVRDRTMAFLAGELKMGMFAIPAKDYISDYKKDGRGVHEYELNLPIAVKRELWRLLDLKCSEGATMPYEYLNRGCAQSTFSILREALENTDVKWPVGGAKYEYSRREFVDANLGNYPWTKAILYLLVGSEADEDCGFYEKIVVPSDLVDVLQRTSIDEMPIITGEYHELLPFPKERKASWFTPMLLTIMLLLLSIANKLVKLKFVDWTLLLIQFTIGLFLVYLVLISDLPCTTWNWLLIPFNPLPLLFWKWRNVWSWSFFAIIVAWIIYVLFASHKLVDNAYIVLACAMLPLFFVPKNAHK